MLEIKFSQNDITEKDMPAINSLMAQLSSTPRDISYEQIQKIMENEIIFTARNNGTLVGMITLTSAHKSSAFFGTVEELVVDKNFRRMGIAKSLMNQVIEKFRELGMDYIELTSNPKREAANKIYPSFGFKLRQTNCYRLIK